MSSLEREYRNEIRKAVARKDYARAEQLRDWGVEHYDLDLFDCKVSA